MQSLTPIQQQLIQALSSGLTITAAAAAAGLHRTTVHHWCRTIPEFRNAVDCARQARIDSFRDQMNELAAPAIAVLNSVIRSESAPPALRVRIALAILKFVTTPEKVVIPKGVDTEMALLEATYAEGHKAGRDIAAGIHHNSSLSSLSSHSSPHPDSSHSSHSSPIPQKDQRAQQASAH